MPNIPKLSFQPGNYAAEWFWGERSVAGEFSADPLRPPEIGIFGDVEEQDWSQGVGLPRDYEYERVAGRTRSGHDIVLTEVHISIWAPGRSLGSARHAVVGLGVGNVPGDAYSRIRFQMTDLDRLFGIGPIKSVSWPAESTPHLHGHFGMDANPDADHHWEEDEDHGLTADCTYDIRFSLSNTHRHEVVFAPVVSLASRTPLTVDEWVDRWVTPMLRLASLATRKAQTLSAAVEDERIPRLPCPKNPPIEKGKRKAVRFLTETEIAKLAGAIGLRYEAMIYVAAYGGLRLGELAALRLDDVDWERRTIRVDEALSDVAGHLSFEGPRVHPGLSDRPHGRCGPGPPSAPHPRYGEGHE